MIGFGGRASIAKGIAKSSHGGSGGCCTPLSPTLLEAVLVLSSCSMILDVWEVWESCFSASSSSSSLSVMLSLAVLRDETFYLKMAVTAVVTGEKWWRDGRSGARGSLERRRPTDSWLGMVNRAELRPS